MNIFKNIIIAMLVGSIAWGAGKIVNADISSSAAIAYSKLNLATSIVNADVNASAAIALSKLAALTASRVPVTDGSGFLSASSITSTTLGYLDATSSIQTQLDAKLPKAGGTMTGLLTTKEVKETKITGGTCSTSYDVDPTAGTQFTLTLNGACTIGVTNLAATHSFILYLTQSSTTGPSFSSAYKWTAGAAPTFSTSATKYDTVACSSPDGTKLICGAIIDAR